MEYFKAGIMLAFGFFVALIILGVAVDLLVLVVRLILGLLGVMMSSTVGVIILVIIILSILDVFG